MHIQELKELAMSRIDDLIAEYCPNGVERSLWVLLRSYTGGMACEKKDLTDNGKLMHPLCRDYYAIRYFYVSDHFVRRQEARRQNSSRSIQMI